MCIERTSKCHLSRGSSRRFPRESHSTASMIAAAPNVLHLPRDVFWHGRWTAVDSLTVFCGVARVRLATRPLPSLLITVIKHRWCRSLLTFFLVFYSGNCYTRYYAFYSKCTGMSGAVMCWVGLLRVHFPKATPEKVRAPC